MSSPSALRLHAAGTMVRPFLAVDLAAIATCFKPADDPAAGGCVLRVWETAGRSEPLSIGVGGFRQARETDLVERDRAELPIESGRVSVPVKADGYAAVRLSP